MRRRDFLLIALVSPMLDMAALAQGQERVWRVGALTVTRTSIDTIRHLTLSELAKRGLVEGRNLVFHALSADGVFERLPALGRELVEAKPDVIIAVGPTAIRAARAASSTIPIVMSFAGEDPVAAGWVQSYARPGGNVTGIVLLSPELDGKRLDILLDTFPALRRIAVLFHPRSINSPNEWAVKAAAGRWGREVMPFKAGGLEEYEATFAAMHAAGVEAVLIGSSTVFRADAARLAELALQTGLPAICEWPDMVEKGCLMSYGPKLDDLFSRTAFYVDRILRGAPPGELPVEDPTTFHLSVNLKSAKALGLALPSSLLVRADKVIE
jgi:putative tryptophan/tyrosine transport system substrate-binding protein